MPTTREEDRFLQKRGGMWTYYRRVPTSVARYDSRRFIRKALRTSSVETARIRRDVLATADDEYWASLALAQAAEEAGVHADLKVAERRYGAAKARAMACGFEYRTVAQLTNEASLEELVARLLAVESSTTQPGTVEEHVAQSVLGGAPEPRLRVSDAFELYLKEIAIDALYNKSPTQRELWLNTKRRSVDYFIDAVEDKPIREITREDALAYRQWWAERLAGESRHGPAKPNTANRHIGDIRSLYTEYFKHIGEEDRPNPFRGIRFKAKSHTETPAFADDWVREKILAPGVMKGLRSDLQLAAFMLIETGCRPSEIINLEPENIKLDCDVPHLSIRPRQGREIKTDSSVRDIPLVGVSLAAARRAANGFPHYRDKGNLFSASLVKAFRTRGLFPTRQHVIYSFRHAFEKRMQEASLDYGLRCLLMGHKSTRPAYGDGGSLAYRRDELLKIVHPFSDEVLEGLST